MYLNIMLLDIIIIILLLTIILLVGYEMYYKHYKPVNNNILYNQNQSQNQNQKFKRPIKKIIKKHKKVEFDEDNLKSLASMDNTLSDLNSKI